ncbi:hypothetical protein [Cupriavidus pampae]|uniref:hypothetical protein n=1 Tax=Cupriavidus pampae TaxID=659251 RepID=UPI001CC3C995|nr:hypothetical protein [Cupriavidus pampae]
MEKNIVSQFASTMSASDMSHTGAPRDPDHYTIKAGAMIFCGILMSLTAIFAVVEFSNRDLKDAFVRLDDKLEKKFELIDKRFELIEKKFERIDLKLDALDRKIEAVDRKVDGLQIEVTHVKQHLEKGERRLDAVEPRLIKLEKHVELTRPAARSGLR